MKSWLSSPEYAINSAIMAYPTPTHPLRYLITLRSVAICAQAITIFIIEYGFGLSLPLTPLLTIISSMAGINLLSWLRLRYSSKPVSPLELFIQLWLDVTALAGLIYFSGGASNPFIVLFLLQVIIAATLLNRTYTWILAIITIGYYSLLMRFYFSIPHLEHHHTSEDSFSLHLQGMWVAFVVSGILVAYFIVRMREAVQQRDILLTEAREQLLRDQHVVALGALAAGAAHELGTPLSTMAILLKELEEEYQDTPDTHEKIGILSNQIARCKESLSMLSQVSGATRAEDGQGMSIVAYLEDIIARWQKLYPAVMVSLDYHTKTTAPQIFTERLLEQAVVSLLTNAYEASAQTVALQLRWDEENITLQVFDDGEGLAPQTVAVVGKAGFTTKPHGQGLGLFLAQSVLQRLGGNITLTNRQNAQGACAELFLPLSMLRVG